MSTLIFAFIVMLVIVLIMSIGMLIARKPIKGSCGGLSAIGMKSACDVCGGDDEACEKEQQKNKLKQEQGQKQNADLAYDATRKEVE